MARRISSVTGFKLNSLSEDPKDPKSTSQIFDSLLTYVKTETLRPIRGAGRWIGFGFVAAISLSIGIVLGALGILRMAQSLMNIDSGSWSWLNYVVTLVVCVVVFVVTISRIRKGTLEKS